MGKLKAYNFYGGGACPTQFFWTNKKKDKFYYFRYRSGVATLKSSKYDFDTDLSKAWKNHKLLFSCVYNEDIYDGYICLSDFKEVLHKHNLDIDIISVINIDYINDF